MSKDAHVSAALALVRKDEVRTKICRYAILNIRYALYEEMTSSGVSPGLSEPLPTS